ncbi:MAG: hypothetical protein DCC58_05115 [Chloroflexi bacterium]|nr:MAG: hypothetical protein DCC58_05115 [Chloroflexota bacterium]
MGIIPTGPLTLNTTPQFFADWLHRETARDLDGNDFPTVAGGRYVLLPSERVTLGGPQPINLGLLAYALHSRTDPKTGETRERYSPPATAHGAFYHPVAFNVLPLAADRIEVTITCREPLVRGYVAELVARMQRTWPEAAPVAGELPSAPHGADDLALEAILADLGFSESHKEIVRRWHRGEFVKDIAAFVDRSPKTVTNLRHKWASEHPRLAPYLPARGSR